jgi:eukaryotic-like serine/threonine-protein kinase
MSSAHSDRNLLFGILAMQMNFVFREDLIAVTSKWIQDKTQAFDELLVAGRLLTDDERKLLSAVVEKHLQKHENDPAQSLAAVGTLAYAVCGELEDQLRTSKVETSLNGYQTLRHTQKETQFSKSPQSQVRDVAAAEPRFRKIRPHAKGGLGEVFVAHDEELHRDVALKEIQLRRAFDQDSQSRFVLEAEITGALEHPGIVPVYSLGS